MNYTFAGTRVRLLSCRGAGALDLCCADVVVSGSSITVMGTNDLGPTYISTQVAFSIDGEVLSIVNTSSFVSNILRKHVPFFVSPSLPSSTTHTLSIEVQNSATVGKQSSFYFDYLVYEATPNSSIPEPTAGTSWIFVDDKSPYLQYDDGWSDVQNAQADIDYQNITDASFNSTLTSPTRGGASVALNFSGEHDARIFYPPELIRVVFIPGVTAIRAFAYLPNTSTSNFLGAYTVDGDTPTYFNPPPTDAIYPFVNYEIFNATLEEVSGDDTHHTVVMTAQSADAFDLDYILLQKSTAIISSRSRGTNNTGGTSSGDGNQSTATPNPNHKMNVGAIVGGVVGAIITLVLSFYLVCLRRRSTRRDYTADTAANITPFDTTNIFGQAHATSQMYRDGLGMLLNLFELRTLTKQTLCWRVNHFGIQNDIRA